MLARVCIGRADVRATLELCVTLVGDDSDVKNIDRKNIERQKRRDN